MNGTLIDTNAYAAFKRGKNEAIEIIQHLSVIAINSIVLGELLAGFAKGNRNEQNRRELQQFLSSPRVIILPINQQTAEHYAKVYLELKQKGIPIPTNDMWICASALQHKLSVFTYDKHFERVSELIVVKTLTDL